MCEERTGVCISDDDILFVRWRVECLENPDIGDGSGDNPFCLIQNAINVADPPRHFIWVFKAEYRENLIFDGVEVILGAEQGTTLRSRDSSSPIITIKNESEVYLEGLRIGGEGSGSFGVLCEDSYIELKRNLIYRNRGGGINIEGCDFMIGSNMIVKNGSSFSGGSEFGGVRITGNINFSSFIHNTISENKVRGGPGKVAGISCVGVNIEVQNSIIWDNQGKQVSNECIVIYSDIGTSWEPEKEPDASGNFTKNPQFIAPSNLDFHLRFTSPCIDMGFWVEFPPSDYDGEKRRMGDGFDVGADEVR
jgi:hypothetical protein